MDKIKHCENKIICKKEKIRKISVIKSKNNEKICKKLKIREKRENIVKPDYQVLVNRTYGLDCNEVPKRLIIPNVMFAVEKPNNMGTILMIYEKGVKDRHEDKMGEAGKKYMEIEAALALERLFDYGKKNGIYLAAVSGFRSYERQKDIFYTSVKKNGLVHAQCYSAEAGHSEHQTGLAMDVSSESIRYELQETFANTKEGKWLKEHCKEEGFIIRYPKGKESITGYAYEPWHIRYVGKEVAKTIMEQEIVLEEWKEINCIENSN